MDSLPAQWRLDDPERARRNLAVIRDRLGGRLPAVLERLLPLSPDADMTLNNLERLAGHRDAPAAMAPLLDGDAGPFGTLLQLLGTSQFFADTLARHPDFCDLLSQTGRANPSPSDLAGELAGRLTEAAEDTPVLRAFRAFRQRQLLRIGVNDIHHDRPLEEITADLSRVADVSLRAAYLHAHGRLVERFGRPSPGCVLAFGKLGGEELNYSSDIDLLFVYAEDGTTAGGRKCIGNDEFHARLVSEVVRLLSAHTDAGQAYRVDLRLRPEGARGPLARSLADTLHYYDQFGRTWERQALIKLRPVAGDLDLGGDLLRHLEPFVYRRYLGVGEINEIKALKRKIEGNTRRAGADERDVKTGSGGIRDIEFTVQFLQLLNGGDSPDLRQRSTLTALQKLAAAGCLSDQEARALDDAYRFLRKTEHRLQLLSDWQTHALPESAAGLDKLARRMGYVPAVGRASGPSDGPEARPAQGNPQKRSPIDESAAPVAGTRHLVVEPMDRFLLDFQEKTRVNRAILEFLLHGSFDDSGDSGPEADLILGPEADDEAARNVLAKYRFRDPAAAYRNLLQLSRENVPFLSTRRCRHFLAAVAPDLFRAVTETPEPDLTLTTLERVAASIGAKAVLWELFRFHPPSLRLVVDLCSGVPFLSEILIRNPGMIDELLDSLVLNRPREKAELEAELAELRRGATDLPVILRSFQDKELLRVGVRDILGKDDIRQTTSALSDLAEVILAAVIQAEVDGLGDPPCGSAVVGLGKLGGREMTYHSDLDLLVIYAEDTHPPLPPSAAVGVGGSYASESRPPTQEIRLSQLKREAPPPSGLGGGAFGDARRYFTELTRRVIASLSESRLYAVDLRLRPGGEAGAVALSVAEFREYFAGGTGRLWERQVLTRGRVVFGDDLSALLREVAFGQPSGDEALAEMAAMRRRLESSASPRGLKRCPGGMMDVEFLVQSKLFSAGSGRQNLWDALADLRDSGDIDAASYRVLHEGYSFLRRVESRLRLATDRALSEYPESGEELAKLSRRMGFTGEADFLADLRRHTAAIRGEYGKVFG